MVDTYYILLTRNICLFGTRKDMSRRIVDSYISLLLLCFTKCLSVCGHWQTRSTENNIGDWWLMIIDLEVKDSLEHSKYNKPVRPALFGIPYLFWWLENIRSVELDSQYFSKFKLNSDNIERKCTEAKYIWNSKVLERIFSRWCFPSILQTNNIWHVLEVSRKDSF